MRYLFVFSGPIAVGKSSVIDDFPGRRLSTRQALLSRTRAPNERGALQKAGDELDDATDGAWVAEEVGKLAAQLGDDDILVVDSVRKAIQIKHLKDKFGSKVIHVHLTAPHNVLAARYLSRPPELREFGTYEEVQRVKRNRLLACLRK